MFVLLHLIHVKATCISSNLVRTTKQIFHMPAVCYTHQQTLPMAILPGKQLSRLRGHMPYGISQEPVHTINSTDTILKSKKRQIKPPPL